MSAHALMMETRIDPTKLFKKFIKLDFEGFDYTEVKGFVGGIAMGGKKIRFKFKSFENISSSFTQKLKLGMN